MKPLTKLQKSVLDVLFALKEIRQHFYLTGGTALAAFYLHHRYSEDLDLFTHDIDIESTDRIIEDGLRLQGFDLTCERRSPTFRRYCINQTLQLDLVRDIDFRIGAPQLIKNIMVDAKKNIAVNKICAIYGRLDPKDYVDLFFLLNQENPYDLFDLFELAKQKDGGLELFQWTKIIADVDTFTTLPRMILPCDLKELKKFFHTIRDQILVSLKP